MTARLPDPLSKLLDAGAYDHPVASVDVVETHISWVLLTGEFAYKIKRPVEHAFVDLRSADRREFFCREELRLNRRFASDLYLDVCEITETDDGTVRINGEGRVVEHAVRMKQFDRDQELDRLLAANAIELGELESFGRDLADIHDRLPVAAAKDDWGRPDVVRSVILDNLAECVREAGLFGASSEVEAAGPRLRARVDAAQPWMTERRASKRVRECHGDLHARNLLRRNGRLVAFDCMEFEPAFRWIDVADEVAFLHSDLEARDRPLHAHAFLNGYLARTGDYHACRFLDVYRAHRALVRAKVEALIAKNRDPAERERARRRHADYIRVAHDALAERKPMLVLMSGVSGSGKTWLAKQIAPRLGAIHLRSDVERLRLDPDGTTGPAERYAPENVARVYAHLARCADDVLSGGHHAIVDATFIQREQRARFRDVGIRMGVDVRVIRCRAPNDVLRARIDERARGRDESEADASVLDRQQERAEPIRAEEGLVVVDADTTDGGVVEGALRALARDAA